MDLVQGCSSFSLTGLVPGRLQKSSESVQVSRLPISAQYSSITGFMPG